MMNLMWIVRALALVAALAAPVALDARQATQPPASQDGFVPVDQLPSEEALPAAPLVAAAYAVAWLAVLIYLWSIWQRLAKVDRELAEVARRIEPGARR